MHPEPIKQTIFVIDDTPTNIKLVETILAKDYLVKSASNGKQALEMIVEKLPDLILLDIMMPEMDGYELCRILKSSNRTRDIPIIFLTAITDPVKEAEGLALGAVDYITKPISLPVLKARVKTQLELMSARRALSNKNRVLQDERELIESIVLRMREDSRFFSDNLDYFRSHMEETSGDILLAAQTPANHQYILLGDFTGHGLPAAIGGPLVASIFYMLSHNDQPMVALGREINRELCLKMPANIFMAAILIDRNMTNGEVKIWSCSMPPLLHIRANKIVQEVAPTGLALGISEKLYSDTAAATIELKAGDRLVAYSDGVVESRSEGGELYGQERLEKELLNNLQKGLPLDAIMQTLTQFTGSRGISDDITLLDLIG